MDFCGSFPSVSLENNIITYRNKVAKVMFLHLSVILFMGGSASVHAGIPHTPPGSTPGSTHPPGKHTPQEAHPSPSGKHIPPEAQPFPPGKHTPPQEAPPWEAHTPTLEAHPQEAPPPIFFFLFVLFFLIFFLIFSLFFLNYFQNYSSIFDQLFYHLFTHTPNTSPPSPREMAAAADGTHPTGMHSCFKEKTENPDLVPVVHLHSKILDSPPPTPLQFNFLFIFIQFSEKFAK